MPKRRPPRAVGAAEPARVALGYVRVSTDKQAEEGVSLDAQAEKIRAMAVVQGLALGEIIVDAETAKHLNRPGMARMLAEVDAGRVAVVIIAKLDRLTRSVRDLAELLERFTSASCSLVSVAESLDTGTAAGRLVLNIMTAVSQWEREAIGERTRDALRHKRSQGQRTGTIPYGYHAPDKIHLVELPAEQAILSTARSLAADGLSLREIAARLNSSGFPTRRGAPWRHQYVANILAA
jgi:DNA invertase Pin-like site-specific DNA recombinase